MAFKPCHCRNIPDEKFEYDEMKPGKYVKVDETASVKKKQFADYEKKQILEKTENVEHKAKFTIAGPGNPNGFIINGKDRGMYYQVRNVTKDTVFPVLKKLFKENYTTGKGKPIQSPQATPEKDESLVDAKE